MSEWFSHLAWWHWWIAAAVFAVIELMVPGAVAIWFAAGAAVVGALVLALPIPWPWQLLVFGALSGASLFLWRRYQRGHPESSDLPQLNQRAQQYIGRVCELTDAISNGYGKARVGDGVWKVRGPDLPVGAKVRVKSADGAVLVVEAA